jgi:hypothetical protein
MMVTFKGFLVGNNYQVDWDGIVRLSHAVAVTRISFVAPRFLWGYPILRSWPPQRNPVRCAAPSKEGSLKGARFTRR